MKLPRLLLLLVVALFALTACGGGKSDNKLAEEILQLRQWGCTTDLGAYVSGDPESYCWQTNPPCGWLGSGIVEVDQTGTPLEGPFRLEDQELVNQLYPAGYETHFRNVACSQSTAQSAAGQADSASGAAGTAESPRSFTQEDPEAQALEAARQEAREQALFLWTEEGWVDAVSTTGLPVEKSPAQKGFFSAGDLVALVVFLALIILWFVEMRPRVSVQQGVMVLTAISVIGGVMFVPLSNLIIGWSATAGLMGIMFLFLTFTGPVGSAASHRDYTNAALFLTAIVFGLFLFGELGFPAWLDQISGVEPEPWVGFYGIAGWFTLLLTLQFQAAAVTTLALLLSVAALAIAGLEMSKRFSIKESVILIIALVLSALAWNWLVGKGVQFMIRPDMDLIMLQALGVLHRLLVWLFATLTAIVAGALLGDTEFVVMEQRTAQGEAAERAVVSSIDYAVFASVLTLMAIIWL